MEINTLASLRSLMEATKFMPFSLECDSLLESALKKMPVEGKKKKNKIGQKEKVVATADPWGALAALS